METVEEFLYLAVETAVAFALIAVLAHLFPAGELMRVIRGVQADIRYMVAEVERLAALAGP